MSPDSKAERKDKIFTLPFMGIMLVELCLKLCNYMQAQLLPLYVIEKGFSSTFAGLTSTAYMLASLLLRPVSGTIGDKKGRYAILIFGTALYSVATGLYFITVPIQFLLVMRVIQGTGFSFSGTGIYALATDHIPESRMAEGIGYLGIAQVVATAMSSAVAIALKNMFGYQTTFAIIFTLSTVNILIILTLRSKDGKAAKPKENQTKERQLTQDKPAEGGSFLSKIVERNALKPSVLIALIMLAVSTINIFLVPYATASGIVNPGMFFILQAIMAFIARMTMSRVQRRFGSTAVMIFGMLLAILALTGLAFRLNLPLLLVCGACYGIAIGVIQPQISAMAVLAASKENRGMANATYFMMMDIGAGASGIIFGALADAVGYPPIYAVAAVIVAGTLSLYLAMRKSLVRGEEC